MSETALPLKDWICFIYKNTTCKEAHHRAQQPNWRGASHPIGHDRCGWFEIAEQGNKRFADE